MTGLPNTSDVDRFANLLKPLLEKLARSGIQDSDKFNHEMDDFLKALRSDL